MRLFAYNIVNFFVEYTRFDCKNCLVSAKNTL